MSLRIIAGQFKGRKLFSPKGEEVRPTAAVVREALFSILGYEIEGARVLDLFAGTGSIGFEALSRGAQRVTFVERLPDARNAILKTAEHLGVTNQIEVIDANAAGKIRHRIDQEVQFDLVFIDPPYGHERPAKILGRIISEGLLAEGAFVVYEQQRNEVQARPVEGLVHVDERRYGRTVLTFFTRSENDG
ncbi:MAG TPA: 16S rRNA (guanine(966)-N(2))-methyltransferase RsmD [bacterium]|nr:16S rRNA (guanine(966)-N(2))-methyltransferase RsmD [bacterium]